MKKMGAEEEAWRTALRLSTGVGGGPGRLIRKSQSLRAFVGLICACVSSLGFPLDFRYSPTSRSYGSLLQLLNLNPANRQYERTVELWN